MLNHWLLLFAWMSIGLSFICPTYCAWMTLVGYAILLQLIPRYHSHSYHALVAAFILIAVFMIPLFSALKHFYYPLGIVLIIGSLFFFLTLYLWLWFLCADVVSHYHWMGISLITIFFWWFIRNYFFLWLGICSGLPILHPLLVLMVYKPVRFMVSIAGIELTLLMIILIVQGSLLGNRLVKFFLWAVLFLSLFFPLSIFESHGYHKIGVTRVPFIGGVHNEREHLQEIHCAVVQLLKKYPDLEMICMPESTIPWDLSDIQKTIFTQAIAQRVVVICGGHQKESEKLFNVAWIFDGDHCSFFKKCHLFRGIESPLKCICNFMRDGIFFDAPAEHSHGVLKDFKILICSELLFDVCLDDCKIIALVNDAWFGQTYISQLLVLLALLQSLHHNLQVLYVSYEYGLMIDGTSGTIFLLPTSSHKTDLGVYS